MRKITNFISFFVFCLGLLPQLPSYSLSPNNCSINVSYIPTQTGNEGQSSNFYGVSYGEFFCALKTEWAILQNAESNPSGAASCHFIHTFSILGKTRTFEHALAGNSNPYWEPQIKDSATLWDRIGNWVKSVYESHPGSENPQGFVGSSVGQTFPVIRGDGGVFTAGDFTQDLITVLLSPSQWPEGVPIVYQILIADNFQDRGAAIEQYQPVNYQLTYKCLFGNGDDGGDQGDNDNPNCPNIKVTSPFPVVRVRYNCQ